MISEIQTIINAVGAGYVVTYEESRMMNLRADEKSLDARFCYIEEFTAGTYERNRFVPQKTTRVSLYFCQFAPLHATALDREAIREDIERTVIYPFINKYNDSGIFDRVEIWNFASPLPRFDANEVSVMLSFNCKQNYYV